MSLVRYCLFCVVAVVLPGCASFDPVTVKDRTAGKPIEVVVGMPTDLTLAWVGTTVFNNESGREKLKGLNVRDVVGAATATMLKESNRYPSIAVVNSDEQVPERLTKSVSTSTNLLLLYPCAAPDLAFQSNQFYRGVGLMQRSMFGLTPRTAMHAVICGEVIDGTSRTSIAKADAVSYQRIEFPYLISGPKINELYWPTVEDSMPFHIRAALSRLLERLGLR